MSEWVSVGADVYKTYTWDWLYINFNHSFPTGSHHMTTHLLSSNKQNVKQIPDSHYFCNITQLYIGACAVYVITHTNALQPFAPWVIQVTKMLQSRVQFRHSVRVIDGMVSGCVSCEWGGRSQARNTVSVHPSPFCCNCASTGDVHTGVLWQRTVKHNTFFFFTLTCTPRGHLQSSVDSTGDLQESRHSGSPNSFDLFNFIANKWRANFVVVFFSMSVLQNCWLIYNKLDDF